MTVALNNIHKRLLENIVRKPAYFTHAVALTSGKTKLVRSSASSRWQADYHRMALLGLCTETVSGCGGHGHPPETTVTYSITALGLEALAIRRQRAAPVNRGTIATDAQLQQEGIE